MYTVFDGLPMYTSVCLNVPVREAQPAQSSFTLAGMNATSGKLIHGHQKNINGLNVWPKDTLTCRQGELGIKPLTLQLIVDPLLSHKKPVIRCHYQTLSRHRSHVNTTWKYTALPVPLNPKGHRKCGHPLYRSRKPLNPTLFLVFCIKLINLRADEHSNPLEGTL